MTEPLIIVGGGGFGRETIDVIAAINAASPEPPWKILGVVDDALSEVNAKRLTALDVEFVGLIDELADWDHCNVAIGVGSPAAREAISRRIEHWKVTFPSLIHPTAVVGRSSKIGVGAIVCAHASIGTNVTLGDHVHLNPHAVIGHDTQLEDFVSVNPSATLSGECIIGQRTLIGAGSVMLQGLSIGPDSTIGAAACVTRSAPASQVLVGVPARAKQSRDSVVQDL